MSNPSVVTLSLAAADADGVCQSQAVAAAGALTLNGALVSGGVATFDVARRVVISSSGADSARTFTVAGTNRYGASQSTTVTGVASGTDQYTTLDFLTVTSVSSDDATAGNITVGTNGVASTEWVVDNFLAPTWNLSTSVVITAGAGTYTVESTDDDPNANMTNQVVNSPSMVPNSNIPPVAWPHPVLLAQAANNRGVYDNPIFAHRLTFNTITSAPFTAKMTSTQAGIGSP